MSAAGSERVPARAPANGCVRVRVFRLHLALALCARACVAPEFICESVLSMCAQSLCVSKRACERTRSARACVRAAARLCGPERTGSPHCLYVLAFVREALQGLYARLYVASVLPFSSTGRHAGSSASRTCAQERESNLQEANAIHLLEPTALFPACTLNSSPTSSAKIIPDQPIQVSVSSSPLVNELTRRNFYLVDRGHTQLDRRIFASMPQSQLV